MIPGHMEKQHDDVHKKSYQIYNPSPLHTLTHRWRAEMQQRNMETNLMTVEKLNPNWEEIATKMKKEADKEKLLFKEKRLNDGAMKSEPPTSKS